MRFIRFIGFAVVRAWQGFWRNAMMSVAATATVVLMLVLLSGLFIVIAGLNSGLEFIESKVGVTARLEDGTSNAEVSALISYVEGLPGVASVDYVGPEEAMERLRQAYRERGEQLEFGGADITLYASIEIALVEPEAGPAVADALMDRDEVREITTKQSAYEALIGVINVIRTVGIIALALVGLTVLFMIVNTIRIAVYSRANEIEIMRLVGASDSFIRWPFILEGILCGLIGAVVTIVLVAVVWDPIQPIMVRVFQMPTTVSAQFLATLSAVILGAGLGVSALGSWISVRSNLSSTT
ncbi:MAG TPA: permease-like cell division protein FtsX [Candidatus Limnocylindria bacterium]|nr:permease-like cell division protein FtsX [Candidatus Limnocylindria bacterium]